MARIETLLLLSILTIGSSFSPTKCPKSRWEPLFSVRQERSANTSTRRSMLLSTILVGATSLSSRAEEALPMMQTSSGLKYIDLVTGTGPSPEYGQFVTMGYKAYIKLPASKDNQNPKPAQFDAVSSYLLKHGNGRSIPGLDEGLHTMKVGGTRRIIIPPKLGYVRSGLGPLPSSPFGRAKLNRLLQRMIDLKGGTVVYEVKLLGVLDDEADQGYYQDKSYTPEQMEIFNQKMLNGMNSGS